MGLDECRGVDVEVIDDGDVYSSSRGVSAGGGGLKSFRDGPIYGLYNNFCIYTVYRAFPNVVYFCYGFFDYRLHNEDVARSNSIVATRKIVIAAKSGHKIIARYSVPGT